PLPEGEALAGVRALGDAGRREHLSFARAPGAGVLAHLLTGRRAVFADAEVAVRAEPRPTRRLLADHVATAAGLVLVVRAVDGPPRPRRLRLAGRTTPLRRRIVRVRIAPVHFAVAVADRAVLPERGGPVRAARIAELALVGGTARDDHEGERRNCAQAS